MWTAKHRSVLFQFSAHIGRSDISIGEKNTDSRLSACGLQRENTYKW